MKRNILKYSLREIRNKIYRIKKLERRNKEYLHLTPNENQLSRIANSFLSSKLSERYYFGGNSEKAVELELISLLGLPEMSELMMMAESAFRKRVKASVINLNCLSGIHAMTSVLLAVTDPGDTVMTVRVRDGGHFMTQNILKRIGRKQIYAEYNLNNLKFDTSKLAENFKKNEPKVIYLDFLSIIYPINLREIRDALGNNVVIIYDASHPLGLIFGGEFQSPLDEGADIIVANTHKTFPGPHKGIVAFKNKKTGEFLNAEINRSFLSTSHTNHSIALAITALEMEKYGDSYARQIIENSNSLGMFLNEKGYNIEKTPDGRFSHSHQLHIILGKEHNRKKIFNNLVNNNISINLNRRNEGEYFLRIGTQEVTRRGMESKEMESIADILHKAIIGKSVIKDVKALNNRFRTIKFSFDGLADFAEL